MPDIKDETAGSRKCVVREFRTITAERKHNKRSDRPSPQHENRKGLSQQ